MPNQEIYFNITASQKIMVRLIININSQGTTGIMVWYWDMHFKLHKKCLLKIFFVCLCDCIVISFGDEVQDLNLGFFVAMRALPNSPLGPHN